MKTLLLFSLLIGGPAGGSPLGRLKRGASLVVEGCDWLLGPERRPRVGRLRPNGSRVLDAEAQRRLREILYDPDLTTAEKIELGRGIWIPARFGLTKDPFDPGLADLIDRLPIRFDNYEELVRASTHGVRWSGSLKTPLLVLALYANALERLLQFYEFFGMTDGRLDLDQELRDLFIDLFNVSAERKLERAGTRAEWEILNLAPAATRAHEGELISASQIPEFTRGRYHQMLMTGGLEFTPYLKMQFAAGRGTRAEYWRHSRFKIRRAVVAYFSGAAPRPAAVEEIEAAAVTPVEAQNK